MRGVTVELYDLDMDRWLVNLYIDLCHERLNFLIDKPRRVAVVGGNRIPFARSNSVYSRASNQDMLTAALDGLVARFSLEGERLGEVAGGAVLKHSRDRDLTRESVLGTRLAPETPAYDVQQACGTGLETTILVANKIALGQIDAGIACGADTTSDAPIGLNEDLRGVLLDANREKSNLGRLKQLTRVRPSHVVPSIPRNEEPRTGLSMGEHCAIMASEWEVGREEQDELTVASHHSLAAAYERGFMEDLVNPYLGLERDQNLRPDSSAEKLAKLGPVFGGEEGTMTAANSTPLSDGASAVLLAGEEWAKEHDLPVLAWLADGQTAAVDHVHKREGLLMAPAYAMPTMRDRLGREKPLGAIDREKLNVNGGSLAAGHPFAATGGRIVASLAKALHERGSGRGAISICAAAGQGVVAILEAPEGAGR